MKRTICLIILLQSAATFLNAQQTDFPKLTGPYLGQKPPGMTPEIFAPGIVSTEHQEHSSLAISPDGKEMWWSRWHLPYDRDKHPQVIMHMTCNNGTWSPPQVASFSGEYIDGYPAYSQSKSITKEEGPLPNMEFVKIEGGSCLIGSKKIPGNKRDEGKHENMIDNDKPQHQVNIKSFQIMTTEITCEHWNFVMGTPPAADPKLAKGNVTYKDVKEFIDKLNTMDPGKNYRLPSETEWEYACWAGTINDGKSEISFDQLDKIAWTNRNSDKKIHQVALKEPNAWGLYDMIGNVLEWCEDEYHPSYDGAPVDGSAWVTSASPEKGVTRGGDCWMELFRCSPYSRDWMFRNKNPHFTIGFRVVRDY